MKSPIQLTTAKIRQLSNIVERFSQVKLLVVGDFILDQFIWGNVSRISPEAPVPVVDVKRETFVPGGSLNVGNNIKTLGATVYPCGVVGNDLRGRILRRMIAKEGIDIGGVIVDASRPTTIKTRVVAHSQQVVRFDWESRQEVSPKERKRIIDFCKKKIKEVDGIIVEDYGKGVITSELLRVILPIAKKYNKFVAVDPKEKHFGFYKYVTIITPNKKEAYSAVGAAVDDPRQTIDSVGKKLLKKAGCTAVLMTLGEEGMALFERNGTITKIPTAAQEVYDVSGAGDTVIAVLSLALGCGAPFQDAALISNLAAGIVVGKVGTACVTKEELLSSFHS